MLVVALLYGLMFTQILYCSILKTWMSFKSLDDCQVSICVCVCAHVCERDRDRMGLSVRYMTFPFNCKVTRIIDELK